MIAMGLFGKLFKREIPEELLTDDERELREYEQNEYNGGSNVIDDSYSEFLVDDVFMISGRGTVVTGTVTAGVFRTGDYVKIESAASGKTIKTVIIDIEQFRKMTDRVSEGANAGLLLKYVHRSQVRKNDIIKKL